MPGRIAQSRVFAGAAAAALGMLPSSGHGATGPERQADAATFVAVPSPGAYRFFGYLDTASITRGKDDVSFLILFVGDTFEEKDAFARSERLSVSCGWGSYRALPGGTAYSDSAETRPFTPEESATRPRFPRPGSIEAGAVAMICAPGAVAPGVERLTFTQAFVRGREAVRELIPPLPVPPVERRGPPPTFPPEPFRFSVVTPSRNGGPTRFVDWAKRQANGQFVSAFTLDVLGPAAPPGQASVVVQIGIFDCTAHTLRVGGRFGFTATGIPTFTQRFQIADQPADPIAAGSPAAAALEATCSGKEPAKTLESIAAAVNSVQPAAAGLGTR